jgi:hypothetical protein
VSTQQFLCGYSKVKSGHLLIGTNIFNVAIAIIKQNSINKKTTESYIFLLRKFIPAA